MSDDIIVTFEQDPIVIEVPPEGKDGVSLVPCGTWDNTQTYDYMSIVYYDGASYLAMKNVPAGTAISNTEYWTPFAAQNSDPSSRSALWGLIQGNIENQLDLQTALGLKADASDVYTKTETDGLLADKADTDDVYTKTESDNLLAVKANSADVYTKTEADGLLADKADSADVYTKTESDNLLSNKANTADLGDLATQDSIDYTSAQLTNKPTLGTIASKADVSSDSKYYVRRNGAWYNADSRYYTKTATDNLLSAKADSADVYSKTDADTLLSAKANSADVYTKTEADDLLDAKANSADLGTMSAENANDYYTKTATDDLLDDKADKTMLTESVESSMTATRNYTSGDLMIVNNQLLRALSNIGSGSTLTIGSNVESVDLETVIAEKAKSADLGTLATQNDVASDNKSYVRKNQAWAELVDPVKEVSGDLVTVTDALAEPVTTLALTIEPVQSGSGDPSPDNVRAISGWSEAKVFQTVKNFIPTHTAESETANSVTVTYNSDGSVTVNGTGSNSGYRYFIYAEFRLPSGSYIFSGQNGVDSTNKKVTLQLYNVDSSASIVIKDDGDDYAFTLSEATNIQVRVGYRAGVSVTNVVMYPMIRLATDDSTFEKYTGPTTTIALGQTVYGGSLDVVNGTLTVTKAIIDLGTLSWTYYTAQSKPMFYADISGGKVYSSASMLVDLMCSRYALALDHSMSASAFSAYDYYHIGINTQPSVCRLLITDDNYTNATDFTTAMNGVQLVYELDSPQTVTLTAQQVELLAGQNNVWADCGSITSMKYWTTSAENLLQAIDARIASANQ